MGEELNVELQNEVIEELKTELSGQPTFNLDVLKIKVIGAIREVKLARKYEEAGYTDEQIKRDLYKYYSTVKNLALYDFAQIGAPFEISHSENSVSRTWTSRSAILKGVTPLAKII